jgi:hypothetical protein
MALNLILSFLREARHRLKQKSPRFFKVITRINFFLLVVAGIPEVLTYFDIELWGETGDAINKILAYVAAYGTLISRMTVATNTDELKFTNKVNNASDDTSANGVS